MRWKASLRWLLPWLLWGCGGSEPDLPELRFETEHFRYHARSDVSVCDGFGEWLEHHYDSVGLTLGARLSGAEKIQIYVFSDLEDMRRNICPEETFACAQGRTVYQPVPYVPHELIHAYVAGVADAPMLFDEALAYIAGCGPGVEAQAVDRDPALVRPVLPTDALLALPAADRERAQRSANGFTRFVIDGHGLARWLEFVRSLSRDAPADDIEQAFLETFGVTLPAALEAWAMGPEQTDLGICLHLAECRAAAWPSAGGSGLSPACVYAVSPQGLLPTAVMRSVSLEERRGVRLRARSSLLASIGTCGSAPRPVVGGWLSPRDGRREELWTDLEPGDYWLQAGILEGGEDIDLAAELGPPLLADACLDAFGQTLSADTQAVHLFGSTAGASDDDPADGLPDLAMSLQVEADRTARLHRLEGQALLCAAGCPAEQPACKATAVSTELAAGTESKLVVQGDAAGFSLRIDLQP
ncbi:MAG TPA: hypothetical protein VJN18_25740 [Polyangiaceae bacterium]|nr:hypothetical protein [Polyangiaceae bacterium]